MMVLRNARYGYEDGGMACGLVPGTSNVELMVTNDEGKSSFILFSKYCMYETVFISDLSLFDVVMNMKRYDIDFDNELEKVESNSRYELEYEYEYDPKTDETIMTKEMYEGIPSEYHSAITFGRKVMLMYEDEKLHKNIDELIKDTLDKELK